MKQLIFDIGGTYIKYAYFTDNDMKIGSFPVVDQNGKEDIPAALRNFLKNYQTVDEIGVSAPGPFDFKNGISLIDFKLTSMYKVNVMNIFKEAFPKARILFIHDAVAFILGALVDDPSLKNDVVAGIMMGTGTGYALMDKGKVRVAGDEATIPHLGFVPYFDTGAKIEDFVSATGIINLARKEGYQYRYVKDMAKDAEYDPKLRDIFVKVGTMLGNVTNQQQKIDHFNLLVIGGGVSNVFSFLKPGYDSVCKVPYRIITDSTKSPINGVRLALKLGKENIYLIKECPRSRWFSK